jgi:hypothetical protein
MSGQDNALTRVEQFVMKKQMELVERRRIRWTLTISALLVAGAHLIWPQIKIDIITLVLLVIAALPWVAPLVKSVELPGIGKIELQDVAEVEGQAVDAGLLPGHDSQELLRDKSKRAQLPPAAPEPAFSADRSIAEPTPNSHDALRYSKTSREAYSSADGEGWSDQILAVVAGLNGENDKSYTSGVRVEMARKRAAIETRVRRLGMMCLPSEYIRLESSRILSELERTRVLKPGQGAAIESLMVLIDEVVGGRSISYEAAARMLNLASEMTSSLGEIIRSKKDDIYGNWGPAAADGESARFADMRDEEG